MITDEDKIKEKRNELQDELKKSFLDEYEEGVIAGGIDALDWLLEEPSIM